MEKTLAKIGISTKIGFIGHLPLTIKKDFRSSSLQKKHSIVLYDDMNGV